MTTKSESRSARERILSAAASLFARRGYHNANVDEIVHRSGTSKGSFYFHFPSKEKMAMGLMEQLCEKLVRKVERSIEVEARPVHRLALAIDTLLLTFSRQRKLAQILLVNIVGQGKTMDRKFLPIRDRFAHLIQRELDRALAAGAVAPMDTDLVSHAWLGALHEVILQWLLAEHSESLTEKGPGLRALLLRSIGVEPGSLEDAPGPPPLQASLTSGRRS